MESRAVKKYIRSSPRKMRLVIDMIRGKRADLALSILRFSTKLAARDAVQVLKSALSNLNKEEEGFIFEPVNVVVKEVFVNQGATIRRIQPAPMGRAYRVRKRTNHLTIVVSSIEKNIEGE